MIRFLAVITFLIVSFLPGLAEADELTMGIRSVCFEKGNYFEIAPFVRYGLHYKAEKEDFQRLAESTGIRFFYPGAIRPEENKKIEISCAWKTTLSQTAEATEIEIQAVATKSGDVPMSGLVGRWPVNKLSLSINGKQVLTDRMFGGAPQVGHGITEVRVTRWKVSVCFETLQGTHGADALRTVSCVSHDLKDVLDGKADSKSFSVKRVSEEEKSQDGEADKNTRAEWMRAYEARQMILEQQPEEPSPIESLYGPFEGFEGQLENIELFPSQEKEKSPK